jgi:hypothetical protein
MKTCTYCKSEKQESDFKLIKVKNGKTWMNSRCAECMTIIGRKYAGRYVQKRKDYYLKCMAENPEKERARGKAWRDKNRERLNAQGLKWIRANPLKRLDHQLKSIHGITLDEYNKKKEEQKDLCASCGKPEVAKIWKNQKLGIKRLSVDHCHTTGKIRDLLCQQCNMALGALREDPIIIRKLADYIERHKKPIYKFEPKYPIYDLGTL